MIRFRRFTALLADVLLLQLVLAGSGVACGARGAEHGHGGNAVATVEARMAMPADHGAGAGGICHSTSASADESCHTPWAAGGCSSMTSCAAVAATPAPGDELRELTMRAAIASAADAAPAGPATPPDSPPPRAPLSVTTA